MKDFLIVGAGLSGATLARKLTDAGKSCLVVEAREHVAGNCYTSQRAGFIVHEHGPHSFHTNDDQIWTWVNRFSSWRTHVLRVKAYVKGHGVFSFPPNLLTFNQLWGVTTPREAQRYFERMQRTHAKLSGNDAESFLLRTVGSDLYRTFFEGYTTKQWGKHPSELPRSIVSRIPLRMSYDDNYHTAKYMGLPEQGYTPLVENMLDGIETELATDFFSIPTWRKLARHIVYTGPLDALYGYKFGKLEYRSLRFEHELLEVGDFQGCSVMNYPDVDTPFTRITEHRHLHGGPPGKTIITHEYPSAEGDPYYPVATSENLALAQKYRRLAEADGIFVAGRLGTYRYMDMDGAVGRALSLADKLLK